MPITPEEQVASRTDPITLPEMLRRLAIELAARDIPPEPERPESKPDKRGAWRPGRLARRRG